MIKTIRKGMMTRGIRCKMSGSRYACGFLTYGVWVLRRVLRLMRFGKV